MIVKKEAQLENTARLDSAGGANYPYIDYPFDKIWI